MGEVRIAVVGAGPAGLTAALAGRQLGLDVDLYERAPDFKQIGGGIMIHSNGQRVLDALGLLEGFEPHMRTTQLVHLESNDGRRLSTFDYTKLDVPHNRAAVVLRHTLQQYLLASAERAGIDVRFGHKCSGVSVGEDGAVVRFENGHEASYRAVLACDGIHSAIRESLGLPLRMRPIGEAYLRGVAELRYDSSEIRELWGSDGRRFGICPLPGEQVYFFCSVELGAWRETLSRGVGAWIDGWRSFSPEVVRILEAVPDWERVNYSELSEIMLDRWFATPVFVVGDAAHAMTPNLGQGANSSMVDALVLMRLLADRCSGAASLDDVGPEYERVRRRFATKIQDTARQIGRLGSWSSGPARLLRDGIFAVSRRSDQLSRPGMLLGAGFNAAEERFFKPLAR